MKPFMGHNDSNDHIHLNSQYHKHSRHLINNYNNNNSGTIDCSYYGHDQDHTVNVTTVYKQQPNNSNKTVCNNNNKSNNIYSIYPNLSSSTVSSDDELLIARVNSESSISSSAPSIDYFHSYDDMQLIDQRHKSTATVAKSDNNFQLFNSICFDYL